MLNKLKICCGCGSKDSVVVPEVVDPMRNVGYETINAGYMSSQTAPRLPSDYPINQRKNSEDDSGPSEPTA